MKQLVITVVTVAVLCANVSAGLTQSKPDFTGTWTFTPDLAARGPSRDGPPRAGAIGGTEVVITQDATTLKVERRDFRAPLTFIHKLDGSETKSAMPGPGSPGVTFRAAWDGSKLTISSRLQSTDGSSLTSDIRQLLSLAPDGTMVVESTVMRTAGDPLVSRVIYKTR